MHTVQESYISVWSAVEKSKYALIGEIVTLLVDI